jgi:murein DD-endopeptidase MepM/ murein hydrolase activator NlpD
VNNFYTVLIIPEKTKQVKKVVLPSVYVRVGLLLGSVGIFFLAFMVYDYVNVMKQLSENKRLLTENRQLKQQMQTFTTKLQTVQDALERIQSYTTKLRIITNQAGENSEQLKKKVAPDIPGLPMDDHSDLPPAKSIPSGHESKASPFAVNRLLADNDDTATPRVAEGNESAPMETKDPAAAESKPATSAPTAAGAASEIPTSEASPAKEEPIQSDSGAKEEQSETPAPKKKHAAHKHKAEPKPEEPAEEPKEAATEPPSATNTNSDVLKAAFVTPPSSTDTATSTSTETAPKPDSEKKLSDLIREDEEQESAALREEFDKLHKAIDSVLQHESLVELDIQSLTTALYDQRDYMNSLPTLKPTNGWYTSGFGVRSSPFTGKSTMHEGLDIANHIGSAILATASGVVTYAGPRAGYGNLVTINHGYGIQTQYGHISKAYVKVGEKVKRGQKVAAVGNTGRSTGPHVHYEVRVNGIPMDPYFYILED